MKIIAFFNPENVYEARGINGILYYHDQQEEAEKKTTLRYYNCHGQLIRTYQPGIADIVIQAKDYCDKNDLCLWSS